MKKNKPKDVIDHRHFFPSEEDEDNDTNRIDVCALESGGAVIWDVDRDIIIFQSTWRECLNVAQNLVDGLITLDWMNIERARRYPANEKQLKDTWRFWSKAAPPEYRPLWNALANE